MRFDVAPEASVSNRALRAHGRALPLDRSRDRIGLTQRCAVRRNALLTAMSLRPRVREPTVRTRMPKLRAWGLSLNGKRVRFLGFVEATDQEAAESAVVDELALSHKQRKRLVVQELPGKVRAAAVSALNLNDEQRSQLVLQGRG